MKKNVSALLVLPVLLFLTACGLNGTPVESTPVTSAAAVRYNPVTMTDQAGREVTVTEKPRKFISSY